MKFASLALAGLLVGCGSGAGSNEVAPSGDASQPLSDSSAAHDSASNLDSASDTAADPCADAGLPPSTLECTGLYADFATKEVSPSAFAYTPATPLWSDGAQKQRWIELPPDTTIDISNPDEWSFPVGTKLFKEFRVNGKRVETRLFQKTVQQTATTSSFWVRATYAWNEDDTATTISYGETVPAPGGDGGLTWTIPTNDECDDCHQGRQDRILGFEQVGLGLPLAQGLTLAQLAAMKLVTPVPASVSLTMGDDGTGLNSLALGWLHVNCGVTCHNSNPRASGYSAGMLLRLDPTQLDGSPPDPATWDILRTTINVACTSGSLIGEPRIVPGDAQASVIHQLIDERGVLQMPPIASTVVDTTDVAVVAAWIQALALAKDAGGPGDAETGRDAQHESDGQTTDAVSEDAAGDAAATTDATVDSTASTTGDASTVGDSSSEDASTADAESDDGGTE